MFNTITPMDVIAMFTVGGLLLLAAAIILALLCALYWNRKPVARPVININDTVKKVLSRRTNSVGPGVSPNPTHTCSNCGHSEKTSKYPTGAGPL